MKEKSREEIFREKKEAELREAKRRAAMKNALSIYNLGISPEVRANLTQVAIAVSNATIMEDGREYTTEAIAGIIGLKGPRPGWVI